MIIFILLFIWSPIIILGFNLWDYFVTRYGGKPNYTIYRLTRLAAAIVHGTICLMFLEDQYYNYGSLSFWQLVAVWAPYLGFQVCSFWILYEVVRNIWTKKDSLLYFDDSENDSGWTDRLFAWLGHDVHALFKIFALVLAILCIILICTRH